MNKKSIEIILGLSFIGLAFLLYGSADTTSNAVSKASTDSTSMYVNALAITLGVSGVFELIVNVISKPTIVRFTKNPKKFSFLILCLMFYVWSMTYIGFIISTILFLVTTMRAMGYSNLIKSLIIAASVTASVYLLFRVGFDIPLPEMTIINEE